MVPWGVLDDCGGSRHPQSVQCVSDATCTVSVTCFQWSQIDANLWNNYIHNSSGFNFNSGCAGGKPCKIVFIVWLTQDSGNVNTYEDIPNTPLYVFTNTAAPQDVVVCISRQGGSTTGWTGPPPITDSLWALGGGVSDYGLWNVNHAYALPGSSSHLMISTTLIPPYTNFSGYPVMYETPIMTAAENFLSALSLHYSSACTFAACTTGLGSAAVSGAMIAPYVAYMRIGPSSGGEDYPYCACTSSVGGSQCDTFYWPGKRGYDGVMGEPQGYSDQGYLTAWPPATELSVRSDPTPVTLWSCPLGLRIADCAPAKM